MLVESEPLSQTGRHSPTTVGKVETVVANVLFDHPFAVFDEFGVSRRREKKAQSGAEFGHGLDRRELAIVVPDQ